jgi:hypothetical protein
MGRMQTIPKPLLGLILGGVLGLLDGLSGLFYPELAPMMAMVILHSTGKGLISGLVIGYVARRVQSLALGIAAGLAIGAVLSYVVTLHAQPALFWDIMLPGALLGLVVGVATQKFGAPAEGQRAGIGA